MQRGAALCVAAGSPAPPHWRAPVALSRCCSRAAAAGAAGQPGAAGHPVCCCAHPLCTPAQLIAWAVPALRRTCRTAWPAPAGCSAGCPCPWAARSWACRPCQSQTRCSRGWQRCGRLRGGPGERRGGGVSRRRGTGWLSCSAEQCRACGIPHGSHRAACGSACAAAQQGCGHNRPEAQLPEARAPRLSHPRP